MHSSASPSLDINPPQSILEASIATLPSRLCPRHSAFSTLPPLPHLLSPSCMTMSSPTLYYVKVLIGVCPLCLNERLLILAAKHGRHPHQNQYYSSLYRRGTSRTTQTTVIPRKSPIYFQKIFAFGSLFNRVEARQWRSENSDPSTSEEDSFISINIGDNGVASLEKNTATEVCQENCNYVSWKSSNNIIMQNKILQAKETKSVVEHGKSSQATLRWRKRIGHWFQLIRWKRSSKSSACHNVGGKVEGVKVRKGWMRPLTKK